MEGSGGRRVGRGGRGLTSRGSAWPLALPGPATCEVSKGLLAVTLTPDPNPKPNSDASPDPNPNLTP